MKIMVVDDEQDVQFLFRQQFKREIKNNQVQLQFAFSANEALQQLEKKLTNCIALLLLDINMPGMSGLEMLKIIKKSFPHLKVFIITAYDDENNHIAAIKYGADDYITKPIEFSELKGKILNL